MPTPDVLATLAKLPPHCFVEVPGSRGPHIVEIVRGVPGYNDVDTTRPIENLNAGLSEPLTPEQAEAMLIYSHAVRVDVRMAPGKGRSRPRAGAQPDHWKGTMTPVTLPRALVHALRHPALEAGDFMPTRFKPFGTKTWFARHMLRFASSDFPRHQFTLRFYNQLMHCFSMIAHYNLQGFWTEYFITTHGKIEFIEQVINHPGYGTPDHTWCDVEREISKRLRQSGLLDFYRQHLSAEQNAAERAELARLIAKYAQGSSAVDPGILRTVLAPTNRSAPPRPSRHGDDTGQLALGLG